MTTRDRLVIVGVLLMAALAGFWFLGLAPKRKEAADLQAQIATQTEQLTSAQAQAVAARQAKARYNDDYAALARLGKAVPKSDALPSLVYQLQSVAHSARIDFTSLKVAGGGGQGPAPAAAAAPAASAGSGAANPSASASGGSSATPAASAPATTSPAPATQAAAATLPPGATVGSAGFPTMPFSFVFSGTFFDMERFLGDVQKFVRVNGKQVDADGRLLSVDGFALAAGPGGFPNVKANVVATAYLRTAADDSPPTAPTAGATTAAAGSTGTGSSAGGAAAPAPTASEVSQ
ncbi:MAG TPA: type 4a pilus biogenesis protein PilO [Solirubrobacteraceae bacterium]